MVKFIEISFVQSQSMYSEMTFACLFAPLSYLCDLILCIFSPTCSLFPGVRTMNPSKDVFHSLMRRYRLFGVFSAHLHSSFDTPDTFLPPLIHSSLCLPVPWDNCQHLYSPPFFTLGADPSEHKFFTGFFFIQAKYLKVIGSFSAPGWKVHKKSNWV